MDFFIQSHRGRFYVRLWLRWAIGFSLLTGVASLSPPAGAVTITMHLNQEGENPWVDPTGGRLKTIADAAAWYWMQYLPEGGNHDVDIWWDDDMDSRDAATWSRDHVGNNNIRINAEKDWFLDVTPYESSEFDFVNPTWSSGTGWEAMAGQVLCWNLLPYQQGISGTPPDRLEAGYRGWARDLANRDVLDLLSTVIHELGHELGVNSPDGGDWETHPSWLGGATYTIFEDSEGGHLVTASALMNASSSRRGIRRFPSAIDIMAVADANDMVSIDLPRKEFLNGLDWNHGASWIGGRVPDSDDYAYIRNGDQVHLTYGATAGSLLLSGGSSLLLEGHPLSLHGKTDVVSTYGDLQSEIDVVASSAQASIYNLTLDGGVLDMNGGTIILAETTRVQNNQYFDGEISGYGTVTIYGHLINSGTIRSDTLMGLTFDMYSTSDQIDLDGDLPEQGVIDAMYGSIVFDCNLSDTRFDGTMKIGVGKSVTMPEDWTMSGLLRLSGASVVPASLEGPTVKTVVKGVIDVDRLGRLATQQVEFADTATVQVTNSDDRLILDTETHFKGGSYTGNGAIEQQGDVHVQADTVIQAHEYDWGNSVVGDEHDTIIYPATSLRVFSETTGEDDNEYRGTIRILGGELGVFLQSGWLLPGREVAGSVPGRLELKAGDSPSPPLVTGVPLMVEGSVWTNAETARIESDFITTNQASISVDLGADLQLAGNNRFAGGTISGDGEISQWGDTVVVSDTTIDTAYYDLDGDDSSPSITRVNPGVTFTINSQSIDNDDGSYDGFTNLDGGALTVNTQGPSWTVGEDAILEFHNNSGPATLAGTHVEIHGNVRTYGTNEIRTTVRFAGTARVQADQSWDILRLRYQTDYEGGTYTGAGGMIQDATAFVNAPTVIDLGFIDLDGSSLAEDNYVELHADLELNVNSVDSADNRFDGTMEITDPASLTVNTLMPWTMAGELNVAGPAGTVVRIAGADVVIETDVNIDPQNELEFAADVSGPGNFSGGTVTFLGDYEPGNSPARVTAYGDARFGEAARLILEIGGTTHVAEHDQLIVGGDLTMDGSICLRFIDDWEPRKGDAFELIKVKGTVQDLLGDEDILIENLPSWFEFDAGFDKYGTFRLVTLSTAPPIPGDLNGDGTVGSADLDTVRAHWGETVSPGDLTMGDASGDGYVGSGDLDLVRSNWGNMAAAVPEPGVAFFGISGAMCLLWCRTKGEW